MALRAAIFGYIYRRYWARVMLGLWVWGWPWVWPVVWCAACFCLWAMVVPMIYRPGSETMVDHRARPRLWANVAGAEAFSSENRIFAAWKPTFDMSEGGGISLGVVIVPKRVVSIKCVIDEAASATAFLDVYTAAAGAALENGWRLNVVSCDARGGPVTITQSLGVGGFDEIPAGYRIGLVGRGRGWSLGSGTGVIEITLEDDGSKKLSGGALSIPEGPLTIPSSSVYASGGSGTVSSTITHVTTTSGDRDKDVIWVSPDYFKEGKIIMTARDRTVVTFNGDYSVGSSVIVTTSAEATADLVGENDCRIDGVGRVVIPTGYAVMVMSEGGCRFQTVRIKV